MSSETITESTPIEDEGVMHALGGPVCVVAFGADGSMKAYHSPGKVASFGIIASSGFFGYYLKDGGTIAIGRPNEPKGLVYSYYEPRDGDDNGEQEDPKGASRVPVAAFGVGPVKTNFPFS